MKLNEELCLMKALYRQNVRQTSESMLITAALQTFLVPKQLATAASSKISITVCN